MRTLNITSTATSLAAGEMPATMNSGVTVSSERGCEPKKTWACALPGEATSAAASTRTASSARGGLTWRGILQATRMPQRPPRRQGAKVRLVLRVHLRFVHPAQERRRLDGHLMIVTGAPVPGDLGARPVGSDGDDASDGLIGGDVLPQGHELAAHEGIVRALHYAILPLRRCATTAPARRKHSRPAGASGWNRGIRARHVACQSRGVRFLALLAVACALLGAAPLADRLAFPIPPARRSRGRRPRRAHHGSGRRAGDGPLRRHRALQGAEAARARRPGRRTFTTARPTRREASS